jgi:ATPase subunit of ABC transporter with duplicated ATPase domains
VVGPNGAGKSTLLRMIAGTETPDQGEIRIGETVQLAYADQMRALDPGQTVYESISDGSEVLTVGGRQIHARSYCSSFNFLGGGQQKRVGDLSGGERNRVHLARTLLAGANVIMLDEPTNDLDVNTLRALEEALVHFAGCAIVVSHDRWFLDRISTHILAFEGDSQVLFHLGNWSDYAVYRKEHLGLEDDVPKRMTYRQIKR